MFRDVLSDTALTSGEANSFFQNINLEPYTNDTTFSASLRALVAPRMPEGDDLSLRFTRSSITKDEAEGLSARDAISAAVGSLPDDRGVFVVHGFQNPVRENNEAHMSVVEKNFPSCCEGYRKIDKITDFYRRLNGSESFNVACFVNDQKKSVFLFAERINISKYHALQMATPLALPWYFTKEAPINEDETALIKALNAKDAKAYLECVAKIAGQYDFKSAHIRSLLDGFEAKFEKQEIQSLKNSVSQANSRIEAYSREIDGLLRDIRSKQARILGLELKVAQTSGDSEIMEYFLCNKSLYLESVDGLNIQFSVKEYLDYIDEDLAERVIANKGSSLYAYTPGIPKDRAEKFLKAVFVDKVLKIRTCAAYELRFPGSVSCCTHHAFPAEFGTYYPNPHVNDFNCLGNYKQAIIECLRNSDYVMAIEQSIASCKSLNLSDSAVIAHFVKSMFGSNEAGVNIRCVELPSGSVVNPKEAIEWLDAQTKEA
jgi:hypothetical protein